VDFLDKKPPEPMQLSVKLVFEATGAVADGRSGAAGGPGCYSAREHEAAVKRALKMVDGYDVELWHHERKIAAIGQATRRSRR
jgi:hypothetical protein